MHSYGGQPTGWPPMIPATWYLQPSGTPAPWGQWAGLVIPSFALPIQRGKGGGVSLLWLGYETSWLPSVSSFSLMASWLHALLKQAACWRGPCNKEPTGGFGQEPAKDWPSHSSSPGGSESYQQPCKLEIGSFPCSVFRCVAGPGGQLYHSHSYLHPMVLYSLTMRCPLWHILSSKFTNVYFPMYGNVTWTYSVLWYKSQILILKFLYNQVIIDCIAIWAF